MLAVVAKSGSADGAVIDKQTDCQHCDTNRLVIECSNAF